MVLGEEVMQIPLCGYVRSLLFDCRKKLTARAFVSHLFLFPGWGPAFACHITRQENPANLWSIAITCLMLLRFNLSTKTFYGKSTFRFVVHHYLATCTME